MRSMRTSLLETRTNDLLPAVTGSAICRTYGL
ncbi:MAG: hypothetical protein QOI38_1129 [Sphingomonadales bacterium]|nr:hypothetical protein [Sphingomonadales bacterium]